jgi:branched-chain amino acid transport system ATP-binding protein
MNLPPPLPQILLQIRALSKRFGGVVATDDVTLDVREGEIHALIGPNGAGKSTLVGQIFGEIRSDSGSIHLAGQDITLRNVPQRVALGIARSFQIVELLPEATVGETMALSLQIRDGQAFRLIRRATGEASRAQEAAARLAESGLDARADVPIAALSHGERKDLELALALAQKARLLLLDEPMAGLGPSETQRMIQRLAGLRGTTSILLIEHDMDAVFALADRISVLVYGRVIASGSAEEIRRNPEVRRAYLGEDMP